MCTVARVQRRGGVGKLSWGKTVTVNGSIADCHIGGKEGTGEMGG